MLNIENLTVRFGLRRGYFTAVNGVSLSVNRGEIHGLVGESGAGKSTIGAALIGLLGSSGYIFDGSMNLNGIDLRNASASMMRNIRGRHIAMIFQDPQTSLNPLLTIKQQLVETIQAHETINSHDAYDRAVSLLQDIGINDAHHRIHAYPHQFSGGMRQRVVIALALCSNPSLIIADEPTTALDVGVQSKVLDLLRHLADERGIGFIMISHDIGVISHISDRVTVLRYGHVVESGLTQKVMKTPRHEYTQALMKSVPRLDVKLTRFMVVDGADTHKKSLLYPPSSPSSPSSPPSSPSPLSSASSSSPQLSSHSIENNYVSADFAHHWLLTGDQTMERLGLSLRGISVQFSSNKRRHFMMKAPNILALDDVTLEVRPGSVMGIVGESGSGKSTLAKVVSGLIQPFHGHMEFAQSTLPPKKNRSRSHSARRMIQMVFQDPYSSLNARHKIMTILNEPLLLYTLEPEKKKRRELVSSMFTLVGLTSDALNLYPHQFSGGQRQRIAIARSLLARPRFLICDEPTSSLDVSIQAQILNLLKDLQEKFGLTILFISHNLAVIRQMADDVAVLRHGKILETAPVENFFNNPQSDYAKELITLTPKPITQIEPE